MVSDVAPPPRTKDLRLPAAVTHLNLGGPMVPHDYVQRTMISDVGPNNNAAEEPQLG
jgi:hypothetical protein